MTTLFIEADEPLLIFPSVEIAQRHIEAVDVHDGVYGRAFGRGGELFFIMAEGESVAIRPSDQPADPKSLRSLLQRSLQDVGEPIPPDADLATLVDAAESFWNLRDPFGDRYGAAVPLWGCLAAGVALAGLAAFIWH